LLNVERKSPSSSFSLFSKMRELCEKGTLLHLRLQANIVIEHVDSLQLK
jgi:hypothetical protein